MSLEQPKLTPGEKELAQFDREKKLVPPPEARYKILHMTSEQLDTLSATIRDRRTAAIDDADAPAAETVDSKSADAAKPHGPLEFLMQGITKVGEFFENMKDQLGPAGLRSLATILGFVGMKDLADGLRIMAEAPGMKMGEVREWMKKLQAARPEMNFVPMDRAKDEESLGAIMQIHTEIEQAKEAIRQNPAKKLRYPATSLKDFMAMLVTGKDSFEGLLKDYTSTSPRPIHLALLQERAQAYREQVGKEMDQERTQSVPTTNATGNGQTAK